MEKIIQLESIGCTLEEAKKFDNKYPSALAWIWNPWKHIPEFELLPVQEMHAMEQIHQRIAEGHFYYAPLKETSL